MQITVSFDHAHLHGSLTIDKPVLTQKDLDFLVALSEYSSSTKEKVVITGYVGSKIPAIKALREALPGMSLAEAKGIADGLELRVYFQVTFHPLFVPKTLTTLRESGLFEFQD